MPNSKLCSKMSTEMPILDQLGIFGGEPSH